jgi:hypothetical protein
MWKNYFDINTVAEICLKTMVYMGPRAIKRIYTNFLNRIA